MAVITPQRILSVLDMTVAPSYVMCTATIWRREWGGSIFRASGFSV